MIISLYNRTRTGSKSDWIGQAGRYNTICWKCQRSRLCKSYGTALDEMFDLYNSRVGLFSGVQTYMSVRKWFLIQIKTKRERSSDRVPILVPKGSEDHSPCQTLLRDQDYGVRSIRFIPAVAKDLNEVTLGCITNDTQIPFHTI